MNRQFDLHGNSPSWLASAEPIVHDLLADDDSFLHDILDGLRRNPKRIPSKYFYDPRGCQLFDQICELDEYYLTRTELAIMEQDVAEMAAVIGPRCMLIEFGSGSSIKTCELLDHLDSPIAYVPVDIACEHLRQTATSIAKRYGDLEVLPVCADFTQPFAVPTCRHPIDRQVVYFPGSTIGNLGAKETVTLLQRIGQLGEAGCDLLIGLDLQKDIDVLHAAYNDRQGVTAEFNLNLLRRANRELNADFQLPQFRHSAIYNENAQRIEMFLVSTADQTVQIGEDAFEFAKGETICTEYSHKYDLDEFAQLADLNGFTRKQVWTDPREYFAIVYFAYRATGLP